MRCFGYSLSVLDHDRVTFCLDVEVEAATATTSPGCLFRRKSSSSLPFHIFIYLWTGIIMPKVKSSGRESGVVLSTGGTPSGTTSRKRILSTSPTLSTASRKSSTIRGSYRRRARGARSGVRTSVPISSTTTKSTFGRLTGGFGRFIDSCKTRVTESSSSTSAPYRLQFGTDYIPVYRISAYGNRLLTYIRLHPTGLIFSSRPSIPLRSSSSVSRSSTPTRITSSAGPSTKPLLIRTRSVREDFISWDQLIGVTCRKRELKITYRNAAQQQNIPVDSGSKPSSESSILNLKFLLLADLKSFLTAGLLYGYFSNEKIAEAVLWQQDGGDVEMGNVSGKVLQEESKNKTKKKGLFRLARQLGTALSSKRNRNSHTINSNESAAPEEPVAISTLATTSTRPSTPPNSYVNCMNLNRKAINNRTTISSPA